MTFNQWLIVKVGVSKLGYSSIQESQQFCYPPCVRYPASSSANKTVSALAYRTRYISDTKMFWIFNDYFVHISCRICKQENFENRTIFCESMDRVCWLRLLSHGVYGTFPGYEARINSTAFPALANLGICPSHI